MTRLASLAFLICSAATALAQPGAVFATGEVRAQGKITLTRPDVTIAEALMIAGGATRGAGDEVNLSRATPAGQPPEILTFNRADIEQHRVTGPSLRDGDIVNVPVAKRFYISGYIESPGSYVLHSGLTVLQAINQAGGLSNRGFDRGIVIIRAPVDGSVTPFRLEAALEDRVLPNDEIKIPKR